MSLKQYTPQRTRLHGSGSRRRQRSTHGILLMTLLLVSLASAADETPAPVDLQHEPIQPLLSPEGLNPAKVSLGERLFYEPRLARDNAMACADCHDLASNGADARARAIGRNGTELPFNTLTVFNSGLNHRLLWNGRARTLEEQVDHVMADAREFASQWPAVIRKLQQDADYRQRFAALYPDGISAVNIRDAIATFERSLVTVNSRFDRYLRGDARAITAQEQAGYRLFKAYGCVACHQGRNVGGNLFQKLGVFKEFFAYGKSINQADLGRFNVTGREQDRHVFRVPSLRLAVLTPPYFHDGSAKTLRDAINIMAEYQLGRSIPEAHVQDIIAFLNTLPGEYRGRPLAGSYDQALTAEAPPS